MAKDTRERILDAALEIFARDGYSGTNIRDIAESVGIVKSALYRHFESKEEIWKAVQDRMIAYYDERFGSVDKLPFLPKNTEELYDLTLRMVDFTIHDRKVILMRRILLTEQFRDERARLLADKYFLYDTEAIFTRVFREMMENGSIRKDDPAILAFSFSAPITVLVHFCDREPEMADEALDRVQRFVKHFIRDYGAGDVPRVQE